MSEITLQDLDDIRKTGLRPTVVGCFINKKKTLIVFQEEYNIWQFPQGGVENKHTVQKILQREMREEMGEDLVKYATESPIYLGRDQIIFKKDKFGSKRLNLDDGTLVKMKGKSYLFFGIKIPVEHLDMEASEFDKYRWLNYKDAVEIANTIYQPGKKRVTLKALDLLKEHKLIN